MEYFIQIIIYKIIVFPSSEKFLIKEPSIRYINILKRKL